MTLALIAAILFGIAWLNHDANIKIETKKERARTITNIPLQDELFCKNLVKIFNDLKKMDAVTPLIGDALFDAIDYLYELYEIPDERTATDKYNNKEKHLATIKDIRWSDEIGLGIDILLDREPTPRYPKDETSISLFKRIWLICDFDESVLSNPNKMFGEANSIKIIDGVKYKYNDCGYLEYFSNGAYPISLYIEQIAGLLTRRDLYYKGYNYSPRRTEALWQWSAKTCAKYAEQKNKYPWIYKDK